MSSSSVSGRGRRSVGALVLVGFAAASCVPGCSRDADSTAPHATHAGPPGEPARLPTTCRDEPGMAYIPGGRTTYDPVGRPAREVDIVPFWIDRYEVTVEDYRACVEAGACKPPYPGTSGYSDAQLNPLVCTWEIADVANLPVNCVDGHQQAAFCTWSRKRVPIAYEWSWAAQGRDQKRRFPWGDAPPSCDLAIVDVNSDDPVRGCGVGRPWPVGSRPADKTRDGVLDMQGNLGEMTLTPFRPDKPPGYLREGFGSAWTLTPNPNGVASSSPSNRDNFSDNSGFRCAKDPGDLPPCTVAD